MPDRALHETQWDSNHRLLALLQKRNDYPDWIVILAFYTALHSLERYFAIKNRHPTGHGNRESVLRSFEPQLGRQFIKDYLDMYNQSVLARYECISPTLTDIQNQIKRLQRIDATIGPLV